MSSSTQSSHQSSELSRPVFQRRTRLGEGSFMANPNVTPRSDQTARRLVGYFGSFRDRSSARTNETAGALLQDGSSSFPSIAGSALARGTISSLRFGLSASSPSRKK